MIRELIQEAKGLTVKKTEKGSWDVSKDGKKIGNIRAIPADDRYEYYFYEDGSDWETFDVKFDRLIKELEKKYK